MCEQALTLVHPFLSSNLSLKEVDISESDDLMSRYGIRIPVIKRIDSGAEIGWPFDQQDFLDFLAE